jgi:hypothetical protein
VDSRRWWPWICTLQQAVWEKKQGRGFIEHGTLRPAIEAALFFVFDVLASDWEDMLTKLALFWVALLGFGQSGG